MRRNSTQKEYNKNKGIVWFIILILLLVFVYYELYSVVSYTLGKKDKDDVLIYKVINIVNNKFFPEKIIINEKYDLDILSLGDMYLSNKVLNAYKKDDLIDSFDYTKEYFKNFDAITASLNTSIQKNNIKLLDLIKDLNISVLATANNNVSNIVNTSDNIDKFSLNQVGINNSKPYIIDKNNIKVGIVSYLSLEEDKEKRKVNNINLLTEDNIDNDLKYLKDNNVDCIIAYLNIANENTSRISAKQKEDVQKLVDKGIGIVLGTGSKVINEINEDRYDDRHTFVVYSMGDFVGEFLKDQNKYSLGINVKIDKDIVKDGTGKIISSKTNVNINKPIEIYNKVNKNFKFINYPINYISKQYSENKIDIDEDLYTELVDVEEEINDILNK